MVCASVSSCTQHGAFAHLATGVTRNCRPAVASTNQSGCDFRFGEQAETPDCSLETAVLIENSSPNVLMVQSIPLGRTLSPLAQRFIADAREIAKKSH